MSTNRVLDNHNSNCKIYNMRSYRFSKYYANVSKNSIKRVNGTFKAFERELEIAKDRLKELDKMNREHHAFKGSSNKLPIRFSKMKGAVKKTLERKSSAFSSIPEELESSKVSNKLALSRSRNNLNAVFSRGNGMPFMA